MPFNSASSHCALPFPAERTLPFLPWACPSLCSLPVPGQGPKGIKIFTNLPRSMDFEEAERSEPTQALQLGPEDIREDGIVQLRYVKFQNVNSVTVSACAAAAARSWGCFAPAGLGWGWELGNASWGL